MTDPTENDAEVVPTVETTVKTTVQTSVEEGFVIDDFGVIFERIATALENIAYELKLIKKKLN